MYAVVYDLEELNVPGEAPVATRWFSTRNEAIDCIIDLLEIGIGIATIRIFEAKELNLKAERKYTVEVNDKIDK